MTEERPTLVQRLRAAPATVAFIGISVAVFAIAESRGSTLQTGTLLTFGADEAFHVRIGEAWRLVSSMFLHIGVLHLVWNSYAGFGWCWQVERVMGTARFAVIYLASGIGGAILSASAHEAVSAGASGAMFGMVGANLVLRWRLLGDWNAIKTDPFTKNVLLNAGLWTVFGFVALNMDHFAHAGGLLTGLGATMAATARGRKLFGWAAVAGALAIGVVIAIRPWWKPDAEDAKRLSAFGAAYMHAEGAELPGLAQDDIRARRFLDLACEAGDGWSCYGLGLLFLEGRGGPADLDRAGRLLDRACNLAFEGACTSSTED